MPLTYETVASLAIGVPGEDIQMKADAGVVQLVHHGLPNRLNPSGAQLLQQSDFGSATQSHSYFGFSLSAGQLGYDNLPWWQQGYVDLVIGEPARTVAGQIRAGVVRIVYGGPAGLDLARVQTWSQCGALPDSAEVNDHFGFSVAVGPDWSWQHNYLVVGSPGEDEEYRHLAGIDRGAIHVLPATYGGLSAVGAEVLYGVSTKYLGSSLAAPYLDRVMAGAPGTAQGGGAVVVYSGSVHQAAPLEHGWMWTQESTTAGAEPTEAGDLFGYSLGAGAYYLWP